MHDLHALMYLHSGAACLKQGRLIGFGLYRLVSVVFQSYRKKGGILLVLVALDDGFCLQFERAQLHRCVGQRHPLVKAALKKLHVL